MRVPLLWGSLLGYALLTLPFTTRLLLSYDEAHYALYGYNLAWSYFDHPPLTGWIQALMLLFGTNEFWLRLPASLAVAAIFVSLWQILGTAQTPLATSVSYLGKTHTRAVQERRFLLAVVLFISAPLFFLLSFAFLPDVMLMALALPIMLQTRQVLARGNWSDYAVLGILLGVAGLAKYSALLLALAAAAYVLWFRGWRALLEPRCWCTVALAILLFVPVLWWNYENSWVSFGYQLEHGLGLGAHASSHWQDLVTGQLLQLAAYGPLLYGSGLAVLIWIIRQQRQELFIIVFFALPWFLLFGISPAFGRFLPHWVAAMFIILLPAIAVMLDEFFFGTTKAGSPAKPKASWSKRVWGGLVVLSLLISLAVVVPLRLLVSGVEWQFPPYQNPQQSLIGWDETAMAIRQQVLESEAEDLVIFVPNWSYASVLAWYARPLPVVVLDERVDQFDLWFGSPATGQSGYLVVPHFSDAAPELRAAFASCELWREDEYQLAKSPALALRVFRCAELLW